MKSYDFPVEENESKPEDKVENAQSFTRKHQIFFTTITVLIWICNGMVGAMRGTTLPDQRDRLGVTLEDMGLVGAYSSIFSLAGVLLNGILADLFISRAMLLISFYLTVGSIVMMVSRFMTDFIAYLVLELLWMFCIASCDAIGQILILRIWKEEASGPTYIIHMGFYIGGALGPFVARPFLSPDVDSVGNYTTNVTTSSPQITETPPKYADGSQIQIAFLIPGLLLLATGLCFLISYIALPLLQVEEEKTGETVKVVEIFHPRSCAHNSVLAAIFFLITFCLYYFLNQGAQVPMYEYLFTYSTESDLGFTKQTAALIDGAFYFAGFIGRLFSGIISAWVSIQTMFTVDLVLLVVNNFALAFWGKSDQVGFVVCALIYSFFSATLWPGCIAWTDNYIRLTSTGFFLAPLGNALGRVVFAPLYATYYDKGNPEVTMYGPAIFVTSITILQLGRQVVGWKQGSRFNVSPSAQDVDNSDITLTVYKNANFEEDKVATIS